jgi:hypothetical protein
LWYIKEYTRYKLKTEAPIRGKYMEAHDYKFLVVQSKQALEGNTWNILLKKEILLHGIC